MVGDTLVAVNGDLVYEFTELASGRWSFFGGGGLLGHAGIQSMLCWMGDNWVIYRGAWALRDRLSEYQGGFDAMMRERAGRAGFDAWVIGDDGDPARARALLDTFDLHGVQYRPLSETVRTDGYEFQPGGAWMVPARQDRFGLVQGMLEMRTEFADNTFYDVSAWTLPLAYNLPFATLRRMPETGEAVAASTGTAPLEAAVAWAVPWNQLAAAPLLQQLLEADARVRVALKPFSAQATSGLVAFQRGTLIVQRAIQEADALPEIRDLLRAAALEGTTVTSLTSTLTPSGPDLGSINFPLLEPIRPLIVGGAGVTAYDAGEQWHLLPVDGRPLLRQPPDDGLGGRQPNGLHVDPLAVVVPLDGGVPSV